MAEGGYIPTEREKRSLECAICLGTFRNPKTLPCLHSYCEDCLVTYAPNGTHNLKCPQCKEETEIPDGDTKNFKSNFHLKELVEEAALRKEVSEPNVRVMCNCCKKEAAEAVARCLDCDQYLCSACLAAHQLFSSMQEHVVANIAEIKLGKVRPKSSRKRELMCPKHPRNKAEIFCTTCEMPICHVCSTLKHKSPEHECVEAAEEAEIRRQLTLRSLEELDRVKAVFTEVTTEADEIKRQVMAQVSKLKEEIEESHELLSKKMNREKLTLIKEVDNFFKKEVARLQTYKTAAEATIEIVRDTGERAQTTVTEASDGDFLFFYNTVKSKIDQLCLKSPDPYEKMRDMIFKPVDYEFDGLLGSLVTSQMKNDTEQTELLSHSLTDTKMLSLIDIATRPCETTTSLTEDGSPDGSSTTSLTKKDSSGLVSTSESVHYTSYFSEYTPIVRNDGKEQQTSLESTAYLAGDAKPERIEGYPPSLGYVKKSIVESLDLMEGPKTRKSRKKTVRRHISSFDMFD